ncbi:MAG: hypothetical protein H7122_04025 [Chitinophagaceae bacterium]|nr:hypothetical protein [Chitinophagaceae bacterium]
MQRIPIIFEHKGKQYSGILLPVQGVGHSSVWHLMINNYYFGSLRYTDRWIFDSNKMPEIADFLGDYVIAWYQ